MIIRQHHFFDSYLSATGAKDKPLTHKILLNEIANIIVVRPDIAISNLEKAGIKTKPDATQKELASAYIRNLNNKALAKSLAYDIASFNRVSFDGKEHGQEFFSAGGKDGGASGGEMNYGDLANSIINLGTAITGAVQSGKANKDAKKAAQEAAKIAKAEEALQKQVAAKQSMIENTIAKLKAQAEAKKKKNSAKNIYVIVGVGAGLLIVGSLFAYYINSVSQKNTVTASPIPTSTPLKA